MHVDVFTSGIWQTTSTVISHRGACLVLDPAYFPRELAAIATRVAELGRAEAVVFTHGHWDHVMGHTALPGAPVWASEALVAAVQSGHPRAAKDLESAREFDSRWYVPRPDGHRWPTALHGLGDGQRVQLGPIPVHVLTLLGHSLDGLGLVVEERGLLLVGDHLSPCEIPFIDDAQAYRATLLRLLDLLAGDIREVIPGHGHRLSAAEATVIARADLAYLDRLLDAAARSDLAAAQALPLPRARDVVGMQEHHRENCAAVGLTG